jgi:hypothetical protein
MIWATGLILFVAILALASIAEERYRWRLKRIFGLMAFILNQSIRSVVAP